MARLAECNTQVLLGQIEDTEGRYDDALLSYQKALLTAQHLQDHALLGMIHREVAVVYGRCKRLTEAVQHIQSALQIYEVIGDRPSQERVRSDLACIYIDNRQFQAVIEPAHKAYQFFKTIQSPLMLSVSAANLAEAYFELSDWPQAEHFAQEVIAQEEPHTYPYGLFTLGRLHRVRRNWEVAAAHFADVVRIAGANEDTLMVAHAQRELGEIYCTTGRFAEAQHELQAALRRFEQMGIEVEVIRTQSTLQQSNEKKSPSNLSNRKSE